MIDRMEEMIRDEMRRRASQIWKEEFNKAVDRSHERAGEAVDEIIVKLMRETFCYGREDRIIFEFRKTDNPDK